MGILGSLIAVVSLWVGWYFGRRSEKASAAQQRLSAHGAATEWLGSLREWAGRVIDVLSEASYTCAHDDGTEEDCLGPVRACRYRLSSLIDQGRFFLPNQNVEEFGLDKPSAYRGWRHAALDPLVAAERVLSGRVGSGRFESRDAALIEMQREFVSAIQRILAPDLHNREIVRLIGECNEARAEDRTLGGLLPDDTNIPTGAEHLLGESRSLSQLETRDTRI